MHLLLDVNDTYDICDDCVYAYGELYEQDIAGIHKRHRLFRSASEQDYDLLWMEFSDYSVGYYEGLPEELQEFEQTLEEKGYVVLPKKPDFSGAKQPRIEIPRLYMDDDSFFWSAYVKHTTGQIDTRLIYFKDFPKDHGEREGNPTTTPA